MLVVCVTRESERESSRSCGIEPLVEQVAM